MNTHRELNVKYAQAPKEWVNPDFKTCLCNNQLIVIYNYIRHHVPRTRYGDDASLLINTLKHCPTIFTSKNVVHEHLAKQVRQFVNDVPFDINTPPLDDVRNPPMKNVFEDCQDATKVRDAYHCVNHCASPTMWQWEYYGRGIYRACPTTLEDFIHSPIFDLFDVLTYRFRLTDFNGLDLNKDASATETWVIQRTLQHQSIGMHMDDNGYRQMAFCYYLTPDDWCKKDGGTLICYQHDTRQLIVDVTPTFNTMVGWTMNKHLGPLHQVTPVRLPNYLPRVALVGFYVKPLVVSARV